MANAESYPHARVLSTPRAEIAERDSKIVPVPLLDAQHVRTAGAEYDSLNSDSERASFDDLIGATRSIAAVVRNTLRFRALAPGEIITPDSLQANPTTNCHGYSIVMSESLQAEGLPHYVSFANEHSFLTLLDETSGDSGDSIRSYSLQGADKHLYAETTLAISGPHPLKQLSGGANYAHNGFYSEEFLAAAGKVLDDDIARKHAWLSFRKEGATRFLETEGQIRQLDKIQIRTYPAELGRQVLSSYVVAQAVARQRRAGVADLEQAADAMMTLNAIFPEMDPRNKFWVPTKLRGLMMQRQMNQEAVDVAHAFDNSRVWDDEAAFFLPDTLRKAGAVTQDQAKIDDAIDIYRDLQRRFINPSLVRRAKDKSAAALKDQQKIKRS